MGRRNTEKRVIPWKLPEDTWDPGGGNRDRFVEGIRRLEDANAQGLAAVAVSRMKEKAEAGEALVEAVSAVAQSSLAGAMLALVEHPLDHALAATGPGGGPGAGPDRNHQRSRRHGGFAAAPHP